MTSLGDDVEIVVFDFDGVMTDNAVWVMEDGHELVRCSRADGLGLQMLHEAGVQILVLSSEANPVVKARCTKLGLPVLQGVSEKRRVLFEILAKKAIDPQRVMYVGNDVNDLECLKMVGVAVVVADAHPSVLPVADLVLEHRGGHGAVREICDRLLSGEVETAVPNGSVTVPSSGTRHIWS